MASYHLFVLVSVLTFGGVTEGSDRNSVGAESGSSSFFGMSMNRASSSKVNVPKKTTNCMGTGLSTREGLRAKKT